VNHAYISATNKHVLPSFYRTSIGNRTSMTLKMLEGTIWGEWYFSLGLSGNTHHSKGHELLPGTNTCMYID